MRPILEDDDVCRHRGYRLRAPRCAVVRGRPFGQYAPMKLFASLFAFALASTIAEIAFASLR